MSQRRQLWERRYGQGADPFEFFSPEPPPELLRLLDEVDLPAGGALDLGCGPGVVTAHLAGRFTPTVGLDLVHRAVVGARELAVGLGRAPLFVVAEAPRVPLDDATFALVFDRGCLRALPKALHARHLEQVARILVPGGVYQLMYFQGQNIEAPALSRRGLRRFAARVLRRRTPGSTLTPEGARSLLPSSMELVSFEEIGFRSPASGRVIPVINAVFRKRRAG
jgi:SAM-dependent methyltransferase